MKERKGLNGNTKGVIRRLESLLEIVVLAIAYYCVFKFGYKNDGFYPYLGLGKFIVVFRGCPFHPHTAG